MRLKSLLPIFWTDKVKETVEFYTNTLGFVCTVNHEEWEWAALQRDKVELMIIKPRPEKYTFEKPAFTGSLYITVDNVDEIWEQLKDKAKVHYAIDNFNHGMREFAIYDNNDYILQFGQSLKTIEINSNLVQDESGYQKIELEATGIFKSNSVEKNYAIVLDDGNSGKRVPVITGEYEAQGIAIVMQKMKPDRPLQHNLMLSMLAGANQKIKEVEIYDIVNDIYLAKIVLTSDSKTWQVEARPSDAITLALLSDVPIYMKYSIFEKYAIIISDTPPAK